MDHFWDAWADCHHYYRLDIRDLPAHEAMALLDRLPNYWRVTATDPLRWRSSVVSTMQAIDDDTEVRKEPVMDPQKIIMFGGEYHQIGGAA